MHSRMLLVAATLLSSLAFGCSLSGLNAQAITAAQTSPDRISAGAPLVPEWKLGEAVKFENLTIFPVTASRWPATDQFITLDAGLKSGQVSITEMGAQAQQGRESQAQAQPQAEVNRLSLRNGSGRPLILIAGEMLLGGQQDRIDAIDRIVPPSQAPTQLAVFCVEPGRWNGAEQFGLTARSDRLPGGTRAISEVAAGAAGGVGSRDAAGSGPSAGRGVGSGDPARVPTGTANGAGSGPVPAETAETVTVTSAPGDAAVGGMANSKVREKAEVSRDQAGVWSTVNVTALANMVVTTSGSLQHVYDDKKVSDHLDRYIRALRARLGAKNIIGVVVAVDGKVQLADIFASPSLFQAYLPKLLKSYALEALSSGGTKGSDVPSVDARAFLSPVRGEASYEGEERAYRLTSRSAQGETSFELEYTGGGSPVLVHFNRISSK